MSNQELDNTIKSIFNAIEKLIPLYMTVPEDEGISNGNLAVCIIDEQGAVHGKMFGTDKPRLRRSYKLAWIKASQVWLTGYKTGEYERMVFTKMVDENANCIEAPDLIGWEGGQPLILTDGTKLSVGFSGFRGVTDLEIMVKSLELIQENQ